MKDLFIAQDNKLIDAQSDFAYTPFELDFINYAIATISMYDEEFKTIRVNISQLYKDIHGQPLRGKKRSDIFNKMKDLAQKNIIFDSKEDPNKKIVTMWFQWIEYEKGEGDFIVEFNDKLIDYLLNLENNFTKARLSGTCILNTTESKRLYLLMSKLYDPVNERKFPIEELRKMLFVGDKHQRLYHFKTRLIEPAIKDINKYSDFRLEYEEQREGNGNKVTHIKITKKDKGIDPSSKVEEFPLF